MSGIPGGGGRYTGTVRVIGGPEEFGRVRPGDVIVCFTTSTTWTILFPIVGAVVGSHRKSGWN